MFLIKLGKASRNLFLIGLQIYKSFFSIYLGGQCRYYPTCSDYSQQAFMQYKSVLKALFVSLKRVLMCHPLTHRRGYDPLPPEVFQKRF